MNPERLQVLERLFHEARSRSGADRNGYLESACNGDGELRRELDELLGIDAGPESVLGLHVREAAADFIDARAGEKAGSRIGPYRLLSLIGKGGMGAVYLAQREEEYDQQVALKLVDPVLLRSPDVLARFRFERQVLAQLNHPNVARLLDGGVTTGGAPYLVMEHIEGTPIDVYVRNRGLGTRERIELVRLVCGAVAHAHGSLIVHRDIKPSNILVTADDVPKLIDFGIAKTMASSDPALTQTRERLLTPGYASPEQVKGDPVTTATDVYALGALLFELLTGKRLFDDPGRSPFEVEIAICQQEPPRPSSLAPLDSDLDAIILKALRKEPASRYASVTAFDDDLRRYLEGYPVEARRGGGRYAAAKFVRRHRVGIGAAALIVIALTWGMISTRRAQVRAERRFAEVRELANQFLFDFNDAIWEIPGATKARSMVVERAIVYLDRLAAESSGDADLQAELARGYERLRDIRYMGGYPSTGDTERAIESGKKAIRLWEGAVSARPAKLEFRSWLGDSNRKMAALLTETRSVDQARPYQEHSVQAYEYCVKRAPGNKDFRMGLAEAYFEWGDAERTEGNAQGARTLIEKSIALKEEVLKTDRTPTNVYGIANTYMGLGDVDRILTLDLKRAESNYQKGLGLAEEALRMAPENEQHMRTVAVAHQRLALMFNAGDRLAEALPHAEATLSLNRALMEKDPANVGYARGTRSAVDIVGNILEKSGDVQRAIGMYRQGIVYGEQILQRDPKNQDAQASLAISVHLLGTALGKTGDRQGSRAALERAAAIREPIARQQPNRVDLQERMAVNYLALGLWHAVEKDCRAAQDYYRKSTTIFERLKDAKKITGYGTKQFARLQDSASQCPAR